MKTNFDDQLKISADGRRLEACGELEWDDPTSNEIVVTVTITQGAVVATKRSNPFVRPAAEWMVDLRPGPGQKFQEGPAQATGVLRVTVSFPAGASAEPDFSWAGNPNLAFDVSD